MNDDEFINSIFDEEKMSEGDKLVLDIVLRIFKDNPPNDYNLMEVVEQVKNAMDEKHTLEGMQLMCSIYTPIQVVGLFLANLLVHYPIGGIDRVVEELTRDLQGGHLLEKEPTH